MSSSENWAWARTQADFRVLAPFHYAVSAKVEALDLQGSSEVKKTSQQTLVWQFDFRGARAKPDVVGGGIAFKFNLADFGAENGEPELLPHNRGWAWGHRAGPRVEMRFDPPLAALHFERGRKSDEFGRSSTLAVRRLIAAGHARVVVVELQLR